MIVAAIDPGSVNAGLAILSDGVPVAVEDLTVVDRMIDCGDLYRALDAHGVREVVVERAQAMPKQGVSSTFRYGVAYGLILGVVGSMRVSLILVPPSMWKRHFNLDADKEKARALALRLYPTMGARMNLKKHSHRAEALLMARWRQETRK